MPIKGAFIVPHPPLLIPEVGRGQQIKIQKTADAYNEVAKKIAELKPGTIIITSPHSVMYSDYIHISPGKKASGSFIEFGEHNVKMDVEYDEELVERISVLAEKSNIPAGTLGAKSKSLDHGVMVPLHFVNKYYKDYKVVRISISNLPLTEHYRFGKIIQRAAEEKNEDIVLIASGDLSHMLKDEGPYGYREEGVVFDREVVKAMKAGDFLQFLQFSEEFCEAAGECGLRSFIIMAGALDRLSVKPKLLSYEGPFGVGYAVAAYEVDGKDKERRFDEIYAAEEKVRVESLKNEEDDYVKLARHALESYVINRRVIKKTNELNEELLKNRAGVFVSLKLHGRLRGCIGTIEPTTGCIADEIIQNAISAGAEDPRFNPVAEEELKLITYSVDVLERAESISSIKELDPKTYGVIVRKGGRSGLLLPNLEGIESAEEQVSIALRKAGISADEEYTLERFKVLRHK